MKFPMRVQTLAQTLVQMSVQTQVQTCVSPCLPLSRRLSEPPRCRCEPRPGAGRGSAWTDFPPGPPTSRGNSSPLCRGNMISRGNSSRGNVFPLLPRGNLSPLFPRLWWACRSQIEWVCWARPVAGAGRAERTERSPALTLMLMLLLLTLTLLLVL